MQICNLEELYDFHYVAINCTKTAKWFIETFSVYKVLCTENIKILIVNSERELEELRLKLSRQFNYQDTFDVCGEGYSVEMCYETVKEKKEFMLNYTETANEKAKKVKLDKLEEQANKKQWRLQNLCRYEDLISPVQTVINRDDILSKMLAFSDSKCLTYKPEYLLNELFRDALMKYLTMLPITVPLSRMRFWFVRALCIDNANLNADCGESYAQYQEEIRSINADISQLCELSVVIDKYTGRQWKEILQFVPQGYYLESDYQTFRNEQLNNHDYTQWVYGKKTREKRSTFKKGYQYSPALQNYFARYIAEQRTTFYGAYTKSMSLFLLGTSDLGSILSTLPRDIYCDIVRLGINNYFPNV